LIKPVHKAVFPVAGLGTRFLPATKAMPKELLPIVDKPLIQNAAEEAIAAGIDTLIFVTGRNKRAIEDHFDSNQELQSALRAKVKNEQADMVRNILPNGVECIFVRQPEQLGLGHAVLCAECAVSVTLLVHSTRRLLCFSSARTISPSAMTIHVSGSKSAPINFEAMKKTVSINAILCGDQ